MFRPGSQVFFRLTKPLLFLACAWPASGLLLGAFSLAGTSLGANPVETIQDTLGQWRLRFLLLTLAITPLRNWTGRAWLLRYRRMLGLFAFFYIALHALVYAGLDLRGDVAHLGEDIAKRPFITIGFVALLLLLPLAVTSTRGWMRRLGRRWKSLHRLVYPAAILGVWHYYWQVKLDALEPTVYALILAFLLGVRLWRWRRRGRATATATA
jgi:sulfoxide reductase heme-binding subunit YedZ